MTIARFPVLTFAVALAAGCSGSSAGSLAGGSGGNGGKSGSGDAAVLINLDAAGPGSKSDAGSSEPVQANLSSDAPSFNWDAHTCVGCAGNGAGGATSGAGGAVASSGGASGSTGSSGSGGSSSSGTGSGGSQGSGGRLSAGGAMGTGGRTGSGGSTSRDAGTAAYDAPPYSADGGGPPDAVTGADLTSGGDVGHGDSLSPDTTGPCLAQIEAVVPVTDSLARFPLVAGPSVRVVLRAGVTSGGPATGVTWTWQASRDGTPLSYAIGTQDPAAAAFPIASGGSYTFTARDSTGACSATVQASAVPANACGPCDSSVILRAAPPSTTDIPVQVGSIGLTGSPPFSQDRPILASGKAIKVAPSVGNSLVRSYVRINGVGGDLVADGLADPQAGGFAARLLTLGDNRAVLKYDVLVVPIDGSGGTTVAATAPQLFQSLTPDGINNASFGLGGGVAVTGATLTASGQAVSDVRVMLTNQDPTAPPPNQLIFSSVGSSDAQGNFLLHAQQGRYWVSVAPPAGSGLAEALAPSSVILAGDTTLAFTWDAPSTATLVLNVVDAAGQSSIGTRVRLTSAQSRTVGTLTVGSSSGTATTQSADGDVQIESTTSAAGVVTFANLPDGADYQALLMPAALGPSSATTTISLTLPPGGATLTARLLAQGRINGQLVAGTSAGGSAQIDWTRVEVLAYDRSSDTPESPLAIAANPDGSFALPVSPGRPYVVLAAPGASSELARTFVGPGPLQSNEFTITQTVQGVRAWSSTVIDESQNGLPGTALQVFCDATWPYCVDPTIPLAETTSGTGGAFQLDLPDPATR